jgi:hypothetical protein
VDLLLLLVVEQEVLVAVALVPVDGPVEPVEQQ